MRSPSYDCPSDGWLTPAILSGHSCTWLQTLTSRAYSPTAWPLLFMLPNGDSSQQRCSLSRRSEEFLQSRWQASLHDLRRILGVPQANPGCRHPGNAPPTPPHPQHDAQSLLSGRATDPRHYVCYHYAFALPAVSQNNPGIQRHATIQVERSRVRWCTGGR